MKGIIESVRKHRDIKLLTTEERRNYLLSKLSYKQKMLRKDLIIQIFSYKDLLQKEKTKKVIGLMKDDLGGKIMTEFVGSKAKTYIYLTDDNDECEKAKGAKNVL